MDVDAATQTMIENLPARTGRTREEWFGVLDAAGLDRHAAAIAFLKSEHGVSHGYANLIVTLHRSQGAVTTSSDLVDAQYAGRKAGLRPLYERLLTELTAFGDDVGSAVGAPEISAVGMATHEDDALRAQLFRGEYGHQTDRAVTDHRHGGVWADTALDRCVVAGAVHVRQGQ